MLNSSNASKLVVTGKKNQYQKFPLQLNDHLLVFLSSYPIPIVLGHNRRSINQRAVPNYIVWWYRFLQNPAFRLFYGTQGDDFVMLPGKCFWNQKTQKIALVHKTNIAPIYFVMDPSEVFAGMRVKPTTLNPSTFELGANCRYKTNLVISRKNKLNRGLEKPSDARPSTFYY